jgi:hypothetical protein
MSANNRTRVISQSKAVYVAPTGWDTSTHRTVQAAQLHGVDTFSFEMDLAGSRQDVREFGQLARIGTVRMSEINPTLSLGYYLQDGANELALGFSDGASTQCIAGMLTENPAKRESNLFVLTATEGDDAFSYANHTAFENAKGDHDVIGFGNAFVSSYSVNMSVGEIPRADIEMQASNVVFYRDIHSGIIPPSLDLDGNRAKPHTDANIALPVPTVCDDLAGGLKVLKPHDVTIQFTHTDTSKGVTSLGGADVAGIGGQVIGATNSEIKAVQSCSIDLPLSREIIDAIGSQLAYAKPLEFPIDVTLSVSALVTEFGQGALEKALTGTAGDNTVDIVITLKSDTTSEMVFTLKKAVLDSQSFSQGLDDNETVDLTFSCQIGGSTTTAQGLFFTTLNGADPRPTAATTTVASPAGQPIT